MNETVPSTLMFQTMQTAQLEFEHLETNLENKETVEAWSYTSMDKLMGLTGIGQRSAAGESDALGEQEVE